MAILWYINTKIKKGTTVTKPTLKTALFILVYVIVNHAITIYLLQNMSPANAPSPEAIFTTESIIELIMFWGVHNLPVFLLSIPIENINLDRFSTIGMTTIVLTQSSQYLYSYLNDRIIWSSSGNILFSCIINCIWFGLILLIKNKLHD